MRHVVLAQRVGARTRGLLVVQTLIVVDSES
jgi:hypothetical protein